jgi:hypothetical protein
MTKSHTLLADVTELRDVRHAMDAWETAGGDLTGAHGRRCFVDGLDNDAADELGGLALTRLARLVFEAKAETEKTHVPGDDTHPAAPDGLPVRAFRLLVVSLLVAAGIAIGAPSAHADNNASLGVSPAHGSPDAQFTATLRWQPSKHDKTPLCAPAQVTFEWDGSALGSAAAALAGDSCVATLRATPPAGTYQGVSTHVISVGGAQGVRARYTVVPAAAAPASPQTPSAATPTATPDSTNTATADVQVSSPAEPGAAANTSGPATPAAAAQTPDNGLTGLTGWIVALGALLFLAGAGAFGAIAWRAHRAKPTIDVPWSSPETANQPADATEPPAAATQALPIQRQAAREEGPQTVQLTPPPAS